MSTKWRAINRKGSTHEITTRIVTKKMDQSRKRRIPKRSLSKKIPLPKSIITRNEKMEILSIECFWKIFPSIFKEMWIFLFKCTQVQLLMHKSAFWSKLVIHLDQLTYSSKRERTFKTSRGIAWEVSRCLATMNTSS